MKDERVNVRAKLSDYERNSVSHQATDEVNVSAKMVQLGYTYRAPLLAGLMESGGKLRATVKRISAFACLYLNKFGQ